MNASSSNLERRLERGYGQIGAFEAELVFLYTDLRTFGQEMASFANRDEFFHAILQPLLRNGQTVLVPTFTYTGDGVFQVEGTPSRLGAINKWIVGQPGARRSEHPLFSVAALGPKADLVLDVGKSAFGARSVFERLQRTNAAFLHVGRPVAVGNTFVHFVEQSCGATYRYHKAFPTEVRRGDAVVGRDYTAFLRRRDVPGFDFDFRYAMPERVLHDGLGVREVGSNADHTNLSCYSYDGAIAFFTEAFYRDPAVFTGADFLEYS